MMTINSKTGELIGVTSDYSSSAIDLISATINNNNGTSLIKKTLCKFIPTMFYSFINANDGCDFDYISNTWVAGIGK